MPVVPEIKGSSGGSPSPGYHVNTPVEAFGGATAQALEHLGHVGAEVSNEIYSRAKALQDLQNDQEATQADTDFMMKSAQLHADFGALQGEAKAKAFPDYIKNVQKVRGDVGATLSNPMAKRMYDKPSRSFMAREIFNGAGQAASAQKQASFNAGTARVDAFKSTITNPQDDIGFEARVQGTMGELDKQGELAGWNIDELNNRKGQALSELWASRIDIMSRTNPFQAQKVLEEAQSSGKLREKDFKAVDAKVRQAMHTTGARNISEAVNSGWAPYMKQNEIDRATGVEPALINIVKEAQRAHPELQFTIGGQGGKRSQAEQDALYAQGRTAPGKVVTWTRDSDHLRGIAVDIEPVRGSPDEVRKAMEEASVKLGIPLQPSLGAKDPGHYALPKDYDTRKAPQVPEEPLQSRVDRASAWARTVSPDDTTFDDYVRQRTTTEFNQGKSIKRDAEFRAQNTIDGAIVGNFGKGNLPTTVEELKAQSPEVAAAWDSLDESKQRKYLSYLGKNAKGDVSWTNDSLRQYQQLKGMAHSDPNEFLAKDVISENLPNSAKRELVNLQQRLKSNAEGDPRVRQAMQLLLPILGPADLARRTDSNKDRYDQFVGALQDQISQYTAENKKAPKNEDIQKMGAQLLQEQADSSKWGFGVLTRKSPMYTLPVPDNDIARIKALPAWSELGITPTDEQVQRVYTREQFTKLYGGAAKKPNGPQLPK